MTEARFHNGLDVEPSRVGSRRANIAHPLRRRKPGLWMQNDCTDQVALCLPVAGRRDRVGAVAHDLTLVRSVVADLFAAGFAVTVFGGWAEELHGLAPAGEHGDIDLMIFDPDIRQLDTMRHAFLGLPRVRVARAWTDLGPRVARHLDRGTPRLPTRPRPNIGWPARLVADPGSSGVESVAARDELVVPSLDRPVVDKHIHSAIHDDLVRRRIRGCSGHRRSALAPDKHAPTRLHSRQPCTSEQTDLQICVTHPPGTFARR